MVTWTLKTNLTCNWDAILSNFKMNNWLCTPMQTSYIIVSFSPAQVDLQAIFYPHCVKKNEVVVSR